MREIKFRAWHEPVKDGDVELPGHMDYNLDHSVVHAVHSGTRAIPHGFGFEHYQEGLYNLNEQLQSYGGSLMQFTGLKDKNGTEIFEGDVVKGCAEHEGQSEVFYRYGVWQPFDYLSDRVGENYEVIGNVYENLELV